MNEKNEKKYENCIDIACDSEKVYVKHLKADGSIGIEIQSIDTHDFTKETQSDDTWA